MTIDQSIRSKPVLVGIDIAKNRHEVLIEVPGKKRRCRLTITNTRDDFDRVTMLLMEYGQPVRIGFEATGTDAQTTRALRRHLAPEDSFPQDVQELIGYFQNEPEARSVRAIPGEGTNVPVYILGSSLYGAQLAAYLGLPYAFASHFAPAMLEEALSIYRQSFKPSATLTKPHAMVAVGICAADTDDEAAFLRSSQMLAFANLRTGKPGKLPYPVNGIEAEISAPVLEQVQQALFCSATGSRATINDQLQNIIDKHQPDELIVTGMIHDHAARIRSFELAAEVLSELGNRMAA